MNIIKKLFQHSNVSTRIYVSKNKRYLCDQASLTSQHRIGAKEDKDFNSVLTDVINSVVSHPGISTIPDLENSLKKLCTYNLTGGKVARGLSVVTSYEVLEHPENITEESLRLACILGWCVEMFQTFLVIIDDMIDASTSRRGKPCWYLVPAVGTSCAMNDAILLYNGMLHVVRKHFGERPYYRDILDTINETMLYTASGQFLDLKTSKLSDGDYKKIFTPERYFTIVKYKTAFYSYDMPIYLGSLMVRKPDGRIRKQVQDLSLDLGALFQIQDDYIDCYGDESVTGKAGTDIQEGKCSWLAVNALQRCNEAQRIVFKACYGSKEPAHIERIKRLYDQLHIPQLYKEVEGHYYDTILEKTKELPTEEWRILFNKILGVTYQREK